MKRRIRPERHEGTQEKTGNEQGGNPASNAPFTILFPQVRGSHRQGILPGTADGTQLGGFFTDPGHFHVDDQVAMTVAAGALIFFSPHSVHGSGPNPSPLPRRALILTYQPGNQPLLKTGEVRNVAG